MNLKHLLFCCLMPLLGYNQDIEITFDDTNNLDLIMIDTVSNPNNTWQIGKPQKVVFDKARSKPNAIVTDTLASYPVNDTSTFYLWYPKLNSSWENPVLYFFYKVDTDSNDYGEVQISMNKGATWYKVGTFLYTDISCSCDDLNNPFKGSSSDWESFMIQASWWNSDSLLFKFTFYSDSISTGRDGWMIDGLGMNDFPQSIQENDKKAKVNITPNPAQATIRFQFLDPNIRTQQELKVYSVTGQLVLQQMINPPEAEINIETLESGVYMYELGDERGKIVVE